MHKAVNKFMASSQNGPRRFRTINLVVWIVIAAALILRLMILRERQQRMAAAVQAAVMQQQRAQFQDGRFRRPQVAVHPPLSEVPNDLPRLHIEIAPTDVETLRRYFWNGWNRQHVDRPEVTVQVREGGTLYTNVALHLKGAAGSFRPFDDKPALTLNFSKHAHGQRFHGYPKISLNNSVQDSTCLCEALCRQLSDAAGIPVPRAQWATVLINDRDLGLYVMLEGADKKFLRRYFKNPNGNLYDGGFCQEIKTTLEAHSGEHPDDHSDLARLLAAATERDPEARWAKLNQVLDVNRFISSLAMEVLMCHWDGYAMNKNNYRIYHDLDTDRMVFIPHGMDQMFGMPEWERRSSPEASIEPMMRGAVARAVMNSPEGRKLYFERLQSLRMRLFDPEQLIRQVQELDRHIRPTLAAYDPAWARQHDRQVATLCDHIRRRVRSVDDQLRQMHE
jgi:spore coat protein H